MAEYSKRHFVDGSPMRAFGNREEEVLLLWQRIQVLKPGWKM
ncbi:amino acid transporter [Alicyclobacillus hesperidum URH17-3-68]|nr:amino acid transporter [Alicyclobacillus hesperidum URH17-3-68]